MQFLPQAGSPKTFRYTLLPPLPIRFMAWYLAKLSSRQMLGLYLKVGHECFFSNPYLLAILIHPVSPHSTLPKLNS
jgi:hypothetical protein